MVDVPRPTKPVEAARKAAGSLLTAADRLTAGVMLRGARAVHSDAAVDRLARHSDSAVRRDVATHGVRRGSPATRRLTHDSDTAVTRALAANPTVHTGEDVMGMALDHRSTVREMVAQRRNLPEPAANLLARDRDVLVRLALTRNPTITYPTLDILANDADELVRNLAVQHPNALPYHAAVAQVRASIG